MSLEAKTQPKVTVLIAAYNAADFIERAIRSALSQSGPQIEVLVVNDASSDATANIVKALGREDGRVRLLSLPNNRGPSAARNAGIDAALGDWLAILDADDAFLPGRLETLVALAEREAADIVADQFIIYEPKTNKTVVVPFQPSPVRLITLHAFFSQARPYAREPDYGLLKPLFRRDFLSSNSLRYPEHSRHGEDFLFMVAALLAGGRYLLHPTSTYLYTSRSSGWSRTTIDYDVMIVQSRNLLAISTLRSDPVARRLLRARISALKRLKTDRMLEPLLRARDLPGLIRSGLREPRVAIALARRIVSRLVF